MRTFFCLI